MPSETMKPAPVTGGQKLKKLVQAEKCNMKFAEGVTVESEKVVEYDDDSGSTRFAKIYLAHSLVTSARDVMICIGFEVAKPVLPAKKAELILVEDCQHVIVFDDVKYSVTIVG